MVRKVVRGFNASLLCEIASSTSFTSPRCWYRLCNAHARLLRDHRAAFPEGRHLRTSLYCEIASSRSLTSTTRSNLVSNILARFLSCRCRSGCSEGSRRTTSLLYKRASSRSAILSHLFELQFQRMEEIIEERGPVDR